MDLDLRTIAALSMALSALTFVTLAAVMRDFPKETREPLRYWAQGIGLLAIGWGLFAARGQVPDLVSVVIANLLLFIGVQSLLFALRAFLGRRVLRWRDVIGPLMQLTVSIVFLWVIPSLSARVALGSLLMAALLAEAARVLWVHAPRPQPMAYHVVGVAFAVMVVILLVRAALQFSGEDVGDVMQASPMQAIVLVMVNLAPLVATSGFLLMISERLQRELQRLATVDPLTGLANRRRIDAVASTLLAERDARLALLAIDADHFKRINDERGHEAGDQVLVQLAERLQTIARPQDLAGRLGGEEFVLLLPGHGLADAMAVAERLRAAVEGMPMDIDGGPSTVTYRSASPIALFTATT